MTQCEPLTHDKEETTDTRNGCTHLPAAALSLTASSLELSRHASRTLVILCRYTDNSQHLRQESFALLDVRVHKFKIRKPNTSDMHFRTHLRLPRFTADLFVASRCFAHDYHSVVVNVFPESLKNMVFALRMSRCCVDRRANLATCPRSLLWCTRVG